MTKEALKNIIDLFNEILSENLKKRHLFFERAEQIVLWIVGFSTASIVLLISNGKFDLIKLQSNNPLILMIIKNLLLVCCFGLSFRIFSFLSELLLDKINKSIYATLKGFHSSLNFEKKKLNNIEDADEITKIINEEFDFELPFRSELNKDPNFIKLLKEIYEKEYENKESINHIMNLFLNYYGFKSLKMFNFFQKPKIIYLRGVLYRVIFYLTIISFTLTIGTLIFLGIEIFREIH